MRLTRSMASRSLRHALAVQESSWIRPEELGPEEREQLAPEPAERKEEDRQAQAVRCNHQSAH